MAKTLWMIASRSASGETAQKIVSRMIIGGSAGLRMMIALPRCGAADRLDAGRGGAGELVDVGAGAGAGRRAGHRRDDLGVGDPDGGRAETAATIGIVAWPPQVIMLTFIAATCSSPLTGGITAGPTAAGVRSIARMPASS